MRGTKYNISIDMLEICYTTTTDVINELINTSYQEMEGFRLTSIESLNKNETLLRIDVLEPAAPGSWIPFGTLKIGSTFEDSESNSRYVWLKIANKALYLPYNSRTPIAVYVYTISEKLCLKINNLTRFDISVDSNVNFFIRIRKAIRTESYTPIVLGRAFESPEEIISRLLYIHTGDRKKYRTDSLNVSTKDKELSLNVYNKSQEIKDSGKTYIQDTDKINATIHRAEVRTKRKSLIDYLDKCNMSFEDLYRRMFSRELLFDMFLFYANRLIRFREANNNIRSILEI